MSRRNKLETDKIFNFPSLWVVSFKKKNKLTPKNSFYQVDDDTFVN